MLVLKGILAFLLIAILVGFTVYNAEERVNVTLLQTRYLNVPLFVVVYWAFISGMLVSAVLFISSYFRQAAEIRKHKRLTSSLTNEVAALRNRSLEEAGEKFLVSDKEGDK